ncbi:DUF2752 domain-containing protein [Gordonia sp. CPCC 206044]|uniref:DUF2752 domain-containing protein n=1 Tax=Gordonia sp. CPCC 206044 TaxID=3140793 RepID=UPI003AF38E89
MTIGEPSTTSGPEPSGVRAGRGGQRVTAGVVAVLGVGALGVAAAVGPETIAHGPDVCPFRRLTGLPCPGCGLTRSWVAMAHGDPAAAFGFNAFGPLVMVLAVVVTIAAVHAVVTGKGTLHRVQTAVIGRVGLATLVIWLGYGIVRAVDAGIGWGLFPGVT